MDPRQPEMREKGELADDLQKVGPPEQPEVAEVNPRQPVGKPLERKPKLLRREVALLRGEAGVKRLGDGDGKHQRSGQRGDAPRIAAGRRNHPQHPPREDRPGQRLHRHRRRTTHGNGNEPPKTRPLRHPTNADHGNQERQQQRSVGPRRLGRPESQLMKCEKNACQKSRPRRKQLVGKHHDGRGTKSHANRGRESEGDLRFAREQAPEPQPGEVTRQVPVLITVGKQFGVGRKVDHSPRGVLVHVKTAAEINAGNQKNKQPAGERLNAGRGQGKRTQRTTSIRDKWCGNRSGATALGTSPIRSRPLGVGVMGCSCVRR